MMRDDKVYDSMTGLLSFKCRREPIEEAEHYKKMILEQVFVLM